ncbi:MAG TPA: lytic transglycosylase domain-containing protein [Fimbriimonas sp.]|nr:lytic transglycosylase domain-containing protein [Fimbriimonas sp.]
MVDFIFEPKGPGAIKERMEELRANIDRSMGRDPEAFKAKLDVETGKRPTAMAGSIGAGGANDVSGPLPPANFADFETAQLPKASKAQIQSLIAQVAREQSMDQRLLRAVVETESDYNSLDVSSKGAMGLMQLMPDTAKEMGVKDVFDPYQNLTGGAKYLKQMISKFDNNIEWALAAYNAGPGAVQKAGGIPDFAETKKYVSKIMAKMNAN